MAFSCTDPAKSVFSPLVGETVRRVLLTEDKETIHFITDACRHIFETENGCCNQVWFAAISGLEFLIDAEVLSVEDKGWGEDEWDVPGYEALQRGFWTLKTSKGYVDLEVRNSHNGYYGGYVVYYGAVREPRYRWSVPHGQCDVPAEITEDFAA